MVIATRVDENKRGAFRQERLHERFFAKQLSRYL